jgi:hypothetical protein
MTLPVLVLQVLSALVLCPPLRLLSSHLRSVLQQHHITTVLICLWWLDSLCVPVTDSQ